MSIRCRVGILDYADTIIQDTDMEQPIEASHDHQKV